MTREEQIKQAARAEYGNDPSLTYTLVCGAFECGAQWAGRNPHWRSVEDELPPLDTDVLCVDKRGEHTISRRVKSPQHDNGYAWCAHYGYTNGGVTLWTCPTHWLPLPTPPKKGDEQ